MGFKIAIIGTVTDVETVSRSEKPKMGLVRANVLKRRGKKRGGKSGLKRRERGRMNAIF
jgi:hypothetical protein